MLRKFNYVTAFWISRQLNPMIAWISLKLNTMIAWLAVLLHIQKVAGLNLSLKMGCKYRILWFTLCLLVSDGIVLYSENNCTYFLPHCFLLTINNILHFNSVQPTNF
jgi:hypothetical protein